MHKAFERRWSYTGMGNHVVHAGPTLPLPPALGAVLLAVGAVVLLVIVYDAYQYDWENEG